MHKALRAVFRQIRAAAAPFDAPAAEKRLSALLLTRQVFLLTLYVSFFALSQLILRHRQVRNPSRNRCFRRLKDPFRPKAAAFRQANAKSPRLLRLEANEFFRGLNRNIRLFIMIQKRRACKTNLLNKIFCGQIMAAYERLICAAHTRCAAVFSRTDRRFCTFVAACICAALTCGQRRFLSLTC